ncbi:hypothetical protein LJB42_000516 [Komagataella kurtzmanii]|nr:hypothetical protein LJB42_000516 [Komagataella kurtzmanii]
MSESIESKDPQTTCCGGKCLSQKSASILTWKNPIKTGTVFGGIIVALLLIRYVNVFKLVFRLATYVLFATASAEFIGKIAVGQGFISRIRPDYFAKLSSKAPLVADHVAKYLSGFELKFQQLLYAENVENTFKAAGISYILYILTGLISVWWLLFVSTLVVFTVPKLYEIYQKEIDEAVTRYAEVAKNKADDLQTLAIEKSKPLLDKAETQLGPVGKYVKQAFPVRTASTSAKADIPAETSEKEVPKSAADVKISETASENISELPSAPTTKLEDFVADVEKKTDESRAELTAEGVAL